MRPFINFVIISAGFLDIMLGMFLIERMAMMKMAVLSTRIGNRALVVGRSCGVDNVVGMGCTCAVVQVCVFMLPGNVQGRVVIAHDTGHWGAVVLARQVGHVEKAARGQFLERVELDERN